MANPLVGVAPTPIIGENIPTEEQVAKLQEAIPLHFETIDFDDITSHHWCEGLYSRVLELKAGTFAIGKRHAKENFFFLAQGSMTMWSAKGMARVSAPFMVVTEPGIKRAVYAHDDVICVTFHPNPDDCRDLDVLESRYIIPENALTTDEVKALLEEKP